MCLAVPGKIVAIEETGPFGPTARVSFGGAIKEVNLSFVPEAKVDDYVIVHTGLALSVLDEAEAAQVLEYLQQLADAEDAEEAAS